MRKSPPNCLVPCHPVLTGNIPNLCENRTCIHVSLFAWHVRTDFHPTWLSAHYLRRALEYLAVQAWEKATHTRRFHTGSGAARDRALWAQWSAASARGEPAAPDPANSASGAAHRRPSGPKTQKRSSGPVQRTTNRRKPRKEEAPDLIRRGQSL